MITQNPERYYKGSNNINSMKIFEETFKENFYKCKKKSKEFRVSEKNFTLN